MKEEEKGFSGYQKLVIFILAATQFTVFLGFMIMAPLGDMLMKSINLSTSQFGVIISAYAFSAGAAGLLTAAFADKFDRKKLLLFFYIGFILGTFLCGLAQSHLMLITARIISGIFGGVISSISLAIVTDIFSLQQRGRVMGTIQMGLGAGQVLGIPVGLYLGNALGWQSAFLAIASLAVIIALLIFLKLKPVNEHLSLQKNHESPFKHLLQTLANRNYRIGFAATALLSVGGYMIMPFSSVFAINNLHVSHNQLPILFMLAGVSSLIIMPLVGRLSDQYQKIKIFTIAAIWMMIMIGIYTQMGPLPFALVVTLNILLQMGILSRTTPSQALISALPEAKDRGAFMSLNAALQQVAGGIAASIAGLIVVQKTPQSAIEHYPVVGYITIIVTLLAIWMMFRINKIVVKKYQPA